MRNLIFVLIFVVIFCASVVVATPADEQTITVTVVGGSVKDTPKEPVTISITEDISMTGRIMEITEDNRKAEFGDADFVVTKNTDIAITQAEEVTTWRLVPHASIIGVTAFKSGDTHLPAVTERDCEIIRELRAGEIVEITWRIPQKPEQPTKPVKEKPKKPTWVNPLLCEDKIIFSLTGVGMMDTIEGHTLPVIEHSSTILVTPVAPYLNAFDIINTRWSAVDDKKLMPYSTTVTIWSKGDNPIDLSKMGSGEYSIIWMDKKSLLLNDSGPFPEFELSESNISDTAKTFYAMWRWTNRKHTQGEWVWIE